MKSFEKIFFNDIFTFLNAFYIFFNKCWYNNKLRFQIFSLQCSKIVQILSNFQTEHQHNIAIQMDLFTFH